MPPRLNARNNQIAAPEAPETNHGASTATFGAAAAATTGGGYLITGAGPAVSDGPATFPPLSEVYPAGSAAAGISKFDLAIICAELLSKYSEVASFLNELADAATATLMEDLLTLAHVFVERALSGYDDEEKPHLLYLRSIRGYRRRTSIPLR